MLLDETLPLNRKERFYTGTVLPAIVTAGDFAALDRLGALMGAPGLIVRTATDDCTILFFTEYGISESAVGAAKGRFDGLPTGRDTPDIVILVTEPSPVLLAIEAKLYDRPGGTALRAQLDAQASLLEPLRERLAVWLGVPEVGLKHVALLPEAQRSAVNIEPYEVITWQEVRAAFAPVVGPSYWLAMLDEALDRYDDLVAKAVRYDATSLTGEEIVSGFLAGDLPFNAMGRGKNGLRGAYLDADIDDRTWPTFSYQVAAEVPAGNRNWFRIEDFVGRLRSSGQLSEDPSADFIDALTSSMNVLTRVGGDGSIAEQLRDGAISGALRGLDPADLRRVARLYATAQEAARLARAEASPLFSRLFENN
jgi:hypothetical protein